MRQHPRWAQVVEVLRREVKVDLVHPQTSCAFTPNPPHSVETPAMGGVMKLRENRESARVDGW